MSLFEIEATLVICSDLPEVTVEEIGSLTDLGPYILRPRSDLLIRDVYYDTSDSCLGDRGLGLRIRSVNEANLITLKGRPTAVKGGGLSREEIELPWSPASLSIVHNRLLELDVKLGAASAKTWLDEPAMQLDQVGLFPVQQRKTLRRPRDVVDPEDARSVLAELVVDSVEFQLSRCTVYHHEVEIELKEQGAITVIGEVSEALQDGWPGTLKPWNHGKRTTGKAVDSLLEHLDANGLISESGVLKPKAYDLLAARLD